MLSGHELGGWSAIQHHISANALHLEHTTEGGVPVTMRTHSIATEANSLTKSVTPRTSPEENTALIQHERMPRNRVSLRSTKVAKFTRIVGCQFAQTVTQNFAPMVARFIKRSQERHERLLHQLQSTSDSVSHSQTPKAGETAVAFGALHH